ncbi:MAG: family 16 glycoside hydrolase [Alistipes sp.]
MKKITLLLLCAGLFLLPAMIEAQPLDARQRTMETIIADNLAQLPAKDPAAFDQVMGELAATGSRGVELIAAKLVPADKGHNAPFEYALSGLAAYVTAPGHEALRAELRKGFQEAITRCEEPANRAFLFAQLQLCSTAEDATWLAPYLNDPYLADHALRALIVTPGTESQLLALAHSDTLSAEGRRALAYAFGEKQHKAAEPILIGWIDPADTLTTAAVYHALAACGSPASLKPLRIAAEQANFTGDRLGATDAYLRLLAAQAAGNQPQKRLKETKILLDCPQQNVRGAALAILVKALGSQRAMPYVLRAIEGNSAEYRFAALQALGEANEEIYGEVTSRMSHYNTEAKIAVINWLGEHKAQSQSKAIIANVSSSDQLLAHAAIEAAGRIGGDEALQSLIEALSGDHSQQALKALLSFNGSINEPIEKLLRSDDKKCLIPALKLAAARHITHASDRIFALTAATDTDIRAAAYDALPAVVEPQHADRVAVLLDAAESQYVAQMQSALIRTLQKSAPETQYRQIDGYIGRAKNPARYYTALAQTNTDQAVEKLLAGYNTGDRETAFAALLTIENPKAIELLYRIAAENKTLTDRALMRSADLTARYETSPDARFEHYRKGLELKPSAAVRARLISYLGGVHTQSALMLAANYLDDDEVAEPAAGAVKTIVAKSTTTLSGTTVRKMLEQAREIFRKNPDADAGYAADEISELLSKLTRYELSPEEKAQGFEVLFDGSSLQKWTGNKTNYVPLNGTINVTAAYGGEGNLYTINEYSDFDLRFEFRFMQQGVNNGIGIRTPMGVDAAFDGMEIQVLDHDAPIYQDLQYYQRHGSVYGVIAAKHVVFDQLGTWHTMEIHAVGDHITVTVNGQVIVDGNIREACQGHNIAPEGEAQNSYMIDHRNHPGLFNKRGHIGLLGHGSGIQYRDIRILDLSNKAGIKAEEKPAHKSTHKTGRK